MIEILLVTAVVIATAYILYIGVRRVLGQCKSRGQRVVRAITVSVVAILLIFPLTWQLARSRSFQLFGETVRGVETRERVVALTFDDGPAAEGATRVLDILREQEVPATFFLTGSELSDNLELGRRMVAEGHELGNHTYTHTRMVARPFSSVIYEVEETDRVIRAAGHTGPIHFRAPYSHKLVLLPYHLSRTDRLSISYDIEPETYPEVAEDADLIVEHTLERVRPGAIILLHVMYPSRSESMRAVEPLIEALKEDGYRFVTVSQLLALQEGAR